MIKDKITKYLKLALKAAITAKAGIQIFDQVENDKIIDIQPPANATFGDYSTSVALKLTKILKKSEAPRLHRLQSAQQAGCFSIFPLFRKSSLALL